ncbi:ShlB/FhaC/HecB family hemolysin secretion/activation protein [Sphingomonas sp. NCPPB 2930]|uniref:ShlB/FhaC/HecB family hemolysin secretion/activation protein n=1 Tax=Sphingomonas sp. NCPPB 2930 TaxID=3162788 RepID=UPI0036DDA207
MPMMLALAPAALAQGAPSQIVPPTLDPNRVQDNVSRPSEPVPSAPPVIQASPQQAVPAAAAATRFVWKNVHIEGATVIPVARLMREWKHAPGEEVSVEDVFRFANAVTRLYAKKGYAISFGVVPEQQIKDGIVTLRVVEGFVSRIDFTGAKLPSGLLGRGPVADIAERIRQSRPLRNADLERYLLLINDVPGVTARATLSPASDVVGGSILTIDIARKRRSMDVGYNSFMPRTLGTHVVGGTVEGNALLTGGDRLRLGAYQSITSNAYWSLSGDYASILDQDGLSLAVSGSYSHTRPTTPLLRLLGYQGGATTGRVGLSYPFIRSRTENLAIEVVGAIANTDSELLGRAEMRDRLRSVVTALTYDVTDAHLAANSLRLGLEQGIKKLDARANSRANGRLDYLLLTMEVQRLQPIARVAGGQVSMLMSGQGQAAAKGPLYSSAECSFGGRRFGRRFDAGALVGDHCLLSSLELRWSAPANIGDMPVGVQAYGFADAGKVWQQGRLLPGERRQASAASAGLGLRLSLTDHISGGIEASRIIRTPNGSQRERGGRLLGNVSFRF